MESEGQRTARYYLEYRENEKRKRNKEIEERGMLNGVFPPEIYKYTSPMQEEAIFYIEELKNPADGSTSIFDKYENVYVTGHSKGGNEATLVTIIYPDLIDRCISGSGQGFSPEFVKYIKKIIGEEGFGKIQDKMYGFHGDNDFVNPTGVIVIKEENRIYFVPEMEIESLYDLVYNHFPQGMINPETGKIAQITEQGPLGKYVGLASEKLMQRNIKDRGDAAIVVMALMQDLFANAKPIYSTEIEFRIDKLDIRESRDNGINVLREVLVESLMEEEGEALINWLAKEFGDEYPELKRLSKAYDSLEMGDGIKELLDQYVQDKLRDLSKKVEKEDGSTSKLFGAMGGDYKGKYIIFGLFSELGVVAINYEKTKELICTIDAMDNLVTGRIIPEMDDIAENLRRMRYWKVNVRRWTDIRDAIEESNNKRMKLKERLLHYYNTCESIELRFVERMGRTSTNVDVMISIG